MSASQHHSEVQALHNQYAFEDDPALASVRPAGTTNGDMRRIARSVVKRLGLNNSTSLLDVGCGSGHLAEHYVSIAGSYLGVDYSFEVTQACELKLQRLRTNNISVLHIESGSALHDLGTFDAVLMYAAFHYCADETEARHLLCSLIDRTRAGGKLLIGNIPFTDLGNAIDVMKSRGISRGWLPWMVRNDPQCSRRWKLQATFYLVAKRLKKIFTRGSATEVRPLETAVVALDSQSVTDWIRHDYPTLEAQLVPTCPLAPLAFGRADLIIRVPE